MYSKVGDEMYLYIITKSVPVDLALVVRVLE